MNTSILLISDSAPLKATICGLLLELGPMVFVLEHAADLSVAEERLKAEEFEAIMLDLINPGNRGFGPLSTLARDVPNVPIIVIAEEHTEGLFKLALESGAQDYLLVDRLDSYTLARAINGAIGRRAVEEALFAEKERAEVTLNSIGMLS